MADLIATLLVLDRPEDASVFPQVGHDSSHRAFQDVYWRCAACFFATSIRQNPGERHAFFTNADALPTVDDLDMAEFLRRLGVEVIRVPITHRLGRDRVTSWNNVFYILDVIAHLDREGGFDRVVVMDSDCAWVRPADGLLADTARHRVLSMAIPYAYDEKLNNASRRDMVRAARIRAVRLGREMHWLRVDRYYSGAVDEPATHFQPVPCMMCEQAPCEVGCPVEATLHDHQGLNQMVYNRCVGTRACSGYCPYKVRRFNYYDYSAGAAPSVQEQRNPSVTVRSRGVMEKCTYCVQRIAEVRITTDKEERPIRDGEVVTACQGACPTRAISFGDLGDRSSAVTRARADGRNYALLGELNARPRTTYLAEFAPPAAAGGIKRRGA